MIEYKVTILKNEFGTNRAEIINTLRIRKL